MRIGNLYSNKYILFVYPLIKKCIYFFKNLNKILVKHILNH